MYKSAYPLHDGDYEYLDDDENSLKMNERRVSKSQKHSYKSKKVVFQLLYLEWAKLRNWYKRQPLWLIKNYFGVKIGLYFAWLGFYTKMLIFPSIMGIICFIFGAATVHSSLNQARYPSHTLQLGLITEFFSNSRFFPRYLPRFFFEVEFFPRFFFRI